ncbi:MAG: hypothetical protein ACYTBX_16195 [Planctomycetota bacterium]|jgi:hypothetical protein
MKRSAYDESNADQTMSVARYSLKLPTLEPTDWHRKFKLMAKKLLVGWFIECLACKTTFIRTTPENWTVGQRGRIFANDTRQQTSGQDTGVVRQDLITGKRKFVGFVRCPDCLSQDVRLAEIGDRK